MLNETFFIIVLLYGIAAYFHGHQASHLAHIKLSQTEYVKGGRVTLNPVFTLILWLYHITFLPWLVMIWLGYQTIWYYPLMVIATAQIVRMILVYIQSSIGLTEYAAYISLFGIVAIPLSLAGIILMTPQITEVNLHLF